MNSDSCDFQYASSSGFLVESDKPLGATGLRNLGNTCYMNAALQSISNCPHLTEFLLQCPALLGEAKPRLATYYQNFLAQLWLPPGCSQSVPLPILREVQCVHPMFMGHSQHDAQEFLRVFLNRLHDELKTTGPGSVSNPKGLKAESGDTGSTDSGFASSVTSVSCECDHSVHRGKSKQKKNRQRHGINDKRSCRTCSRTVPTESSKANNREEPNRADADGRSIITDVFQGKLISAVRCLSCNELSCREEPFLDLSLSLRRPEAACSSESGVISKSVDFSQNRFKSDSSCRSRQPLGTTRLALPTNSLNRPLPALSSKSKALSVKEDDRARLSRKVLHSSPWQPLARLDYPISLARRFLAQMLALISISLMWVFSRMKDVRGWVYQPTLTLEDCLADYFSQAELNGDNKYSCERCKKLCNGLNQYALLSLPEVLCVHLKRFRSHYTDASKITAPVSFPLHNLDLSPYLHEDCTDEVTTYDLVSVICHHGGYGGGHYIAYALNWHNRKWYEFDDDLVTERDPEQIAQLTSEAYILFYKKQDNFLGTVRHEAELLMHQHLDMQSDKTVFISRPWFVRFNIWSEPGPITNMEFLCEHGNVQPQLWNIRDSLLFPIPERLWSILSSKFGGGPLVRNPSPCAKCQDAILTRQKNEWNTFQKLYDQTNDGNSGDLYVVSSSWFSDWEHFVRGETFNAPGPIDNSTIAEYRPSRNRFAESFFNTPSQSMSALSNRPRVKVGVDYQALSEDCWNMLFDIYGGGPTICLRSTAPSSSPQSEDQRTVVSQSPRPTYLDMKPQSALPTEIAMKAAESLTYSVDDTPIFYKCSSDSGTDLSLSDLPAHTMSNSISEFKATVNNHGKSESEENCHFPTLPNGDIYETVTNRSAFKTELPTTRSEENITLPHHGDAGMVSESSGSETVHIKCNGPWHSLSVENLNLNQSLVPVPLMAGDGPAVSVDSVEHSEWVPRLQTSNRKRARFL